MTATAVDPICNVDTRQADGVLIAESSAVRSGRVVDYHFHYDQRVALVVAVASAALVLVASCSHDIPVIAVGPKAPDAHATIYGVVRTPVESTPAVGRTVEVVNVGTGERRDVQTSTGGAFTIEVPAGRYRLSLPLRDGETLVKGPGELHLDRGQIKSHIEFVVAEARLARPHGPAYRVNNGLGPPIA